MIIILFSAPGEKAGSAKADAPFRRPAIGKPMKNFLNTKRANPDGNRDAFFAVESALIWCLTNGMK
jgi:hypothetical protein